jgi:hypothetical protein
LSSEKGFLLLLFNKYITKSNYVPINIFQGLYFVQNFRVDSEVVIPAAIGTRARVNLRVAHVVDKKTIKFFFAQWIFEFVQKK